MSSGRRRTRDVRLGTLRRRYLFVLNPYEDARFTRCPKCGAKTRIRKLPLVIHVENVGLVFLGKTCRICPACDILIAHRWELEQLLSTSLGHRLDHTKFIVLGTGDRAVWRRGHAHPISLDAVKNNMAGFKGYLRVEFTPTGWYPKKDAG